MDWATLLHRVWDVDALKCPRCEGPMKFIATITDRAVIVRILAHLGLPAAEVVAAPARRWDDTS
jgi:ketopantoate hydroxymethyltransferase